MESQHLSNIAEVLVMERGLPGLTSRQLLMAWAEKYNHLQHQLVLKRLAEIAEEECQFSPSEESQLFHAESQIMQESGDTEMEEPDFFDSAESLYQLTETQMLTATTSQSELMDDEDDALLFNAETQILDKKDAASQTINIEDDVKADACGVQDTQNSKSLVTPPPDLIHSVVGDPELKRYISEILDLINLNGRVDLGENEELSPLSNNIDESIPMDLEPEFDTVPRLTEDRNSKCDGRVPGDSEPVINSSKNNYDIVGAAAAAAGISSNNPSLNSIDPFECSLDEAFYERYSFSQSTVHGFIPSSVIPNSQPDFQKGDLNWALQHLSTISQLKKWALEFDQLDNARVQARFAQLGDTDAFIDFELQRLHDFSEISRWASDNGLTSHPLVREKLISIALKHDILNPETRLDELIMWARTNDLTKFRPEAPTPIRSEKNSTNAPVTVPNMSGRVDNTTSLPIINARKSPGTVQNETNISALQSNHSQTYNRSEINTTAAPVPNMIGRGVNSAAPLINSHESRSNETNPSAVQNNHLETNSTALQSDVRHSCIQCGKTFAFKHDLLRHIKGKHENQSYPCSKCSKTFSSASNLTRHILTCKGKIVKGYECLECKKTFSTTSGLKRHTTSYHTSGDKKVTCKKQLPNRHDLHQHKKTCTL